VLVNHDDQGAFQAKLVHAVEPFVESGGIADAYVEDWPLTVS
jgi:hypothetical protein